MHFHWHEILSRGERKPETSSMCLMSKQKEDKLLAWLLQGPGIFSTTERRQEAEAEQRVCVCVCILCRTTQQDEDDGGVTTEIVLLLWANDRQRINGFSRTHPEHEVERSVLLNETKLWELINAITLICEDECWDTAEKWLVPPFLLSFLFFSINNWQQFDYRRPPC